MSADKYYCDHIKAFNLSQATYFGLSGLWDLPKKVRHRIHSFLWCSQCSKVAYYGHFFKMSNFLNVSSSLLWQPGSNLKRTLYCNVVKFAPHSSFSTPKIQLPSSISSCSVACRKFSFVAYLAGILFTGRKYALYIYMHIYFDI